MRRLYRTNLQCSRVQEQCRGIPERALRQRRSNPDQLIRDSRKDRGKDKGRFSVLRLPKDKGRFSKDREPSLVFFYKKFLKKGVDTEGPLCYFNIAVAKDRKKDLKKI